ncbi:uncharacterized protein LOC142577716 [Dermacentor variabilis]|uniref:uncharacterized protein LOC142577716 n=1 Tax=Dermacentor variabilis TaxID=34621 RepID=UPI003F5AF273
MALASGVNSMEEVNSRCCNTQGTGGVARSVGSELPQRALTRAAPNTPLECMRGCVVRRSGGETGGYSREPLRGLATLACPPAGNLAAPLTTRRWAEVRAAGRPLLRSGETASEPAPSRKTKAGRSAPAILRAGSTRAAAEEGSHRRRPEAAAAPRESDC